MKIRNGFVSNSSSSSFLIHNVDRLGVETVKAIHKHIEISQLLDLDMNRDACDSWYVKELPEQNQVRVSTDMDNFDMHHFLVHVLNIPERLVEHEDS